MRIKETTARVVPKRAVSIAPNAPKRSPNIAPTPVTFASSPFVFAYSAETERSVLTISGSTGFSLGNNSTAASAVTGMDASIAFPSSDGNAKIGRSGSKYFESGTLVPSIVFVPIVASSAFNLANLFWSISPK